MPPSKNMPDRPARSPRKPRVSKDDAVASGRTILPGEPNPNSPKPRKPRTDRPMPGPKGGKPKMPLPSEPMPANPYKQMKKAFQTPGMQPGEREAIARIQKNRGVSKAEARAIGKRRTSKGLTTAGVAGPGGNPRTSGGRKNVMKDVAVRDIRKPGGPVNGTAPGGKPTAPETPISSAPARKWKRSDANMPKRPTKSGSK